MNKMIMPVLLTSTLMSFTSAPVLDETTQISKQVLSALKHRSADEYALLFPSLEEFHQMMDDHAMIYGNNLSEAKREFTIQYNEELMPALKESFQILIGEGLKRGLDWSRTRFVKVERLTSDMENYGTSSLIIVIQSQGLYYRIQLDRALKIQGELRVSQFVKLV